jgi:two-component system nitrogen regulation response regulator GlnG
MGGADDLETLQPAIEPGPEHELVPSLTILGHPDVDRIGERARLTDLRLGRAVALSRNEPAFAAPGRGDGRGPGHALLDPYVSRRPIGLAPAPRGYAIEAKGAGLVVEGAAVTGSRVVTRAELERGVVIELADRVALLFHLLGEPRAPTADLGLVGHHESIDELRRDILRVADLDVAVLIRGETGTGKELVARAVHAASTRAKRAFVSVNVAAIPPATAAAELFGHARGAFTGADAARPGYFDHASGGTLFLDEIGATPSEVQPMLLRALESREIQPLGSALPREVDVRLIAATDADLERAIEDGSFRSAVLHRLEGYQLVVPPLRERREDIGRLLVHFLRRELATIGEAARLAPPEGAAAPWLSTSLVARLARHDWPGNVRQLRNVVRQLCISSRGLPRARVDSRLERLLAATAVPPARDDDGPEPADASGEPAPAVDLQTISDDDVRAALRLHDYRIADAAAALGVSRSGLYHRIKERGTIRQAKDLTRAEIDAIRARCGGDLARMARELEVSRRALATRIRELGGEGE